MCAIQISNKGDGASDQLKYLARMSRKSLIKGETALAIEQIAGCIRLVHGLPNSKRKRKLIDAHAVFDHWRLGCCHAALGLERRPSNRMSKALRASVHRWVQRALPLPVGSSAMTAR